MTTPPAGPPPATDPPPAPAAPGKEAPKTEGPLGARVDALEQKIDRVLERLSGTGAPAHAAPPAPAAGAPVEDLVRAEIARGRQEEAAAAAAEQEKTAMQQLRADVAALRETRPEPPVRQIERLMWGRHARRSGP